MLNLTWVGLDKFKATLSALPEAVRQKLIQQMNIIVLDLRNHVIVDKLSGQVLNKRTGHLQQSIQSEVTSDTDSVTGRVYSSGDVKYAAIHEYGGDIHRENGKKSWIIHMPERSYMRSSLRDRREAIIDRLNKVMGR